MAKSSVRFRDTVASFQQISKAITQKKYAPIYLLMGEEGFFIDRLSDQIGEEVLSEAEKAFNFLTVYGKESDAGQVINLARQIPMMGQRQVIIIKEAQQLRQIEKLSLYCQKPAPTTLLVLCHKDKNLDKRSALYKACVANGTVFESVRPRDYEIATWLQEFIKEKGLQIETKALSMLLDHLGTDLSKIENEVDKLSVALPESRKMIQSQDIESQIGISKDFNNFELCKAVVMRDEARAFLIADHFSANPKDNPLLLTISALFTQFKDLFTINYLNWRTRFKHEPFPSDGKLMQLMHKSNPYVIKELKAQAPLWNNHKVFNILGLMRTYDAKSKGLEAGGASNGELLRELLLKIFLQ